MFTPFLMYMMTGDVYAIIHNHHIMRVVVVCMLRCV